MSTGATALPAQPFFSTPQQRLALARQQYFDEGRRPSGLVSEGVLQSWGRCVQARRSPGETIAFDPVSASRAQSVQMRSRGLVEAADDPLAQLEAVLAGTRCVAILTDPQGVVVRVTRATAHADDRLVPVAGRVGVNLAEPCAGTNAPGLTAHTGQPSLVLGGEHFFGCLAVMHCAAAPIRDVHGRLAGVLDLSQENQPFAFDAAAVVGMAAMSIENRLLRAQSREHIVVQLQATPALLDTPMEGLLGVDGRGTLAWANATAARLLGALGMAAHTAAEDALGLSPAVLAALTAHTTAVAHRLPSGLQVWLRASMQARDGARGAVGLGALTPATAPAVAAAPRAADAVNTATPATLRDCDQQLIQATVARLGGNVSQAARELGVSRGLIYRRLRAR
jgi:transcriptional regulator of acetoin/glycerol metabolism